MVSSGVLVRTFIAGPSSPSSPPFRIAWFALAGAGHVCCMLVAQLIPHCTVLLDAPESRIGACIVLCRIVATLAASVSTGIGMRTRDVGAGLSSTIAPIAPDPSTDSVNFDECLCALTYFTRFFRLSRVMFILVVAAFRAAAGLAFRRGGGRLLFVLLPWDDLPWAPSFCGQSFFRCLSLPHMKHLRGCGGRGCLGLRAACPQLKHLNVFRPPGPVLGSRLLA